MTPPIDAMLARQEIEAECARIREFLLEKNEKYGNSVFEPQGLFSEATPVELIAVRIDDKLARVREARRRRHAGLPAIEDEDVTLDLIGYLILLRIGNRLLK